MPQIKDIESKSVLITQDLIDQINRNFRALIYEVSDDDSGVEVDAGDRAGTYVVKLQGGDG